MDETEFCSQIPGGGARQATGPLGAAPRWGRGLRGWGAMCTEALWWFPQEGMGRQGEQAYTTSLNNIKGPWSAGAVSGCLASGPGVQGE